MANVVRARAAAVAIMVCWCAVCSSAAASPAKQVTTKINARASPSPAHRPASPRPAGQSVPMCAMQVSADYDLHCLVDPSYLLSTNIPAPRSPYSAKLLFKAAKSYVCGGYATEAKCTAVLSDTCLWNNGACYFAHHDNAACPTSRVTAFLQCDYFNLAAAKAASCTASKPCAFDKARGCHHPSFSKWTPAALVDYRNSINDSAYRGFDFDLPSFGCCSSFITFLQVQLRLKRCDPFDEETCTADTGCEWDLDECRITLKGYSQAEVESLTTADAPFVAAYKKADTECAAQTHDACDKKRAPLNAAKLAKYRRPHKEAALDPKKYCSNITGPY